MMNTGDIFASVYTEVEGLVPEKDKEGWYHIRSPYKTGKSKWPIPAPGGFNYYHKSSQHFIDCILEGKDPVNNVEWGRHITEMMYGALVSGKTGARYEMTTTPTGLR